MLPDVILIFVPVLLIIIIIMIITTIFYKVESKLSPASLESKSYCQNEVFSENIFNLYLTCFITEKNTSLERSIQQKNL